MIILAHRGWWLDPSEKNTRSAFQRAFAAGHGVETDVRDLDGKLVVSHDMPRGPDLMPWDEFLSIYSAHGCPSGLAVNIKSDGLHAPLAESLERAGVKNAFVFDMAVPDALGYLSRGVTTFTRHSEIEPTPPFYSRAHGVWMDCFDGDWIDEDDVLAHRAAGKTVALVSPDLHRRPYQAAWHAWRGLSATPGVMLCTDFPGEAEAFFN